MTTTGSSPSGNNNNNNASSRHHPKTKLAIVVVKRKKKSVVQRTKPSVIRGPRSSSGRGTAGLPTFQPRANVLLEATQKEQDIDDLEFQGENVDLDGEDYAFSDTLMSIHSLQQGARGLFIPLHNNAAAIQVVLESQIFQKFKENHASTVWSELRQLTKSNQVRQLLCQGASATATTTGIASSFAFILTKDYVRGVWDAHQHHSHSKPSYNSVVTWFVSSLSHWTASVLPKSEMEERWAGDLFLAGTNDQTIKVALDDAIRYLTSIQVLLRETTASTTEKECFVLWLPNWGLVLKSWSDARQQLLGVVARAPKGEISESNLLNKNRHASISTPFLLDELKQQGMVRIVQRPFGRFVQRASKAK